jgi:O-succinylbenzoate synthase
VAADESIRRSSDPWAVRQAEAADLIVLKVQPLGGIEPCLRLAEQWDMHVVVSSALETSVGLRAGLALAGALPELRYVCGLNTIGLLGGDVTTDSLRASGGEIVIAEVSLDPCRLEQVRADTSTVQLWTRRLSQCQDYCARERSHHG